MITDPILFAAAWNNLPFAITSTQHTAWGVTITKSGGPDVGMLGTALAFKGGKPVNIVSRLMFLDTTIFSADQAMGVIAEIHRDLAAEIAKLS